MNQKRGQITIFIIIGILIVVSVGILYYISPPEEIEVEELDVTPIKEYITSCLDSITKNALVTIGMQGGYLYDFGLNYATIPEDGGSYDVYYGIIKPYLIDEEVWEMIKGYFPGGNPSPAPPNYPWEHFPDGESFRPGLFGKTKLPSISYGDRSIQSQLKRYIEENLGQCLNLSVFKEQGFKIEEGQEEIKVIISLDGVVAILTYPLEISKFEQKTNLEEFSTTINVRFGRIHSFIRNLILNDISDIMFDIDDPANDYDGISVLKFTRDSNDLITILDSKSSLYGKPYQFRFMRENRWPALHKDITSCTEVLLKLDQNYFDPDEDNITDCMAGGTGDEWEAKICDDGALCDWI